MAEPEMGESHGRSSIAKSRQALVQRFDQRRVADQDLFEEDVEYELGLEAFWVDAQ